MFKKDEKKVVSDVKANAQFNVGTKISISFHNTDRSHFNACGEKFQEYFYYYYLFNLLQQI